MVESSFAGGILGGLAAVTGRLAAARPAPLRKAMRSGCRGGAHGAAIREGRGAGATPAGCRQRRARESRALARPPRSSSLMARVTSSALLFSEREASLPFH